MRPPDMRRILSQQPFKPFRMCLVDGTTYEIRHPDQLVVTRSTVQIAGGAAHLPPSLVERDVIVSLLHISRLEPIETLVTPPTSSN